VIKLALAGALSASLVLGAAIAAPGTSDSVVDQREKRFEASGADIQAIFKTHLKAGDVAAIEAAAGRMADWAEEMPSYFPAGSDSEGAKPEIWQNFSDFEEKAAANANAARHLQAVSGQGNMADVVAAAKALGVTCKACHNSYRNKK